MILLTVMMKFDICRGVRTAYVCVATKFILSLTS